MDADFNVDFGNARIAFCAFDAWCFRLVELAAGLRAVYLYFVLRIRLDYGYCKSNLAAADQAGMADHSRFCMVDNLSDLGVFVVGVLYFLHLVFALRLIV